MWLRRGYRRLGATAPETLNIGPTLRRSDINDIALSKLLYRYVTSMYAKGQRTLQPPRGALHRLVATATQEPDLLKKCALLLRALTFARPLDLHNVLVNLVLPVFFDLDPNGIVLPFVLNEEVDRLSAVLRGGYAISHYPIADLRSVDKGFPTRRLWDQAFLVNFFDALLSIIQVVSYPYISLIHGGPIGLHFVFIFSNPPEYAPPPFPSTWLHDVRSEALMADEAHDSVAVLQNPESEEACRLGHRRLLAKRPLAQSSVLALTEWALKRLGSHVLEFSDPASFLDGSGDIDLVFALEHSLSWLRVLQRTVHSLSTEEMPMGKFIAFDVADLIDGLRSAFKYRDESETFKLLFNPDTGRTLLNSVLGTVPTGPREYLVDACDLFYNELRETISRSVWVSKTRTPSGFLVRSKDGTNEVEEPVGKFVANVMRALRNTHHGYKIRTCSRYLAPITGNTPNSIASLPLIWTLALIADPLQMTGWEPLPANAYPELPP